MNRSYYFNYVEEKLNMLSYRIMNRGSINLLDLNIYSETFFADLTNHLFGFHLKNINSIKFNMEAIDLEDTQNKIIVQVSSTCTKEKIEMSLSRIALTKYIDYSFKFIAIAGDASNLRRKEYSNPSSVAFDPTKDIYDIKSLLRIALNLQIDQQREFCEFLRKELGNIVDIVKVDSNLASIIHILSKEKLADVSNSLEVNSFEISRKVEFNDLSSMETIIDDYKIYYGRLDQKYKEFDKQGANKSFSVLSIIRNQYHKLSATIKDSRQLFYSIIHGIIDIIMNSKNYVEIPYEELDLCVSILVVDAFIRCKIFKNPEGYNHVTTR